MARTKAATETTADPTEARPALSGPSPVLLAMARLGAAVAAVARFPNQPVPGSLTDRIDAAQIELAAAISADEGQTVLTGDGQPPAYDDTWITARFESLDTALKARFDALDKIYVERLDGLDAKIAELSKPAKSQSEA